MVKIFLGDFVVLQADSCEGGNACLCGWVRWDVFVLSVWWLLFVEFAESTQPNSEERC